MRLTKKWLKIILNRIYFPFLLAGAIKKFQAARAAVGTKIEAWNLAVSFYYGLALRGFNFNIRPSQEKTEILALMNTVEKIKPRVILEIGTATGGTLFFWSQVAAPDATIISLDLPFGKFGAGYLSAHAKFYQAFARDKQQVELIAADSHLAASRQKIKEILGDQLIDFLFIDGDHRYAGAKQDFLDYSPLVRPGGLIAFHDIVPNPDDPEAEAYKFWREIKNNYRYEEYIRDPKQNGYGIGLIYLP